MNLCLPNVGPKWRWRWSGWCGCHGGKPWWLHGWILRWGKE